MILNDHQIYKLCKDRKQPMLDPYVEVKSSTGLTFGPSSFGYDIRLGNIFIKYDRNNQCVDPKDVSQVGYFEVNSTVPVILDPGDFVLGHSLEKFTMPHTVTGFVKDKSTYARCGIAIQNTVIEAGWEGILTIEISNHNCCPVKLYPGEGIAQVIFHEGKYPSAAYKGKYQNQTGVTLPR